MAGSGAGLKPAQAEEVVTSLHSIPVVSVTAAEFVVEGEEADAPVMEGDVVTCSLRLMLSRPAHRQPGELHLPSWHPPACKPAHVQWHSIACKASGWPRKTSPLKRGCSLVQALQDICDGGWKLALRAAASSAANVADLNLLCFLCH